MQKEIYDSVLTDALTYGTGISIEGVHVPDENIFVGPDSADSDDSLSDLEILLHVRNFCPSVKSDFSRANAQEIGKLASESLITTYAGNGTYGHHWYVTILGLELLVDYGVLSGKIEGILWANR